ncbi:MAG: hypothetical protein JSR72_23440, partial [Proteobacteria bacterium]|nr:hypothetical protein [Pseudomonadota bacterium]
MPILPLPQFELDVEEDRKAYEALKPPTSIVVRFGSMKLVGEFPYSGDAKPGCGSKFVVKTHRGTELAEMLTSTCPNAGCSKSVTRKEMLEYIDNSGGKDYPFFSQGRVVRLATPEDLNEQTRLDALRPQMIRVARAMSERMLLPIKIVDAEPILGQEKLTFHFISEERVDFRDLVAELAKEFHTRIEMHQVGARDEARLTADYERCGQHCCCKQFLKVLKPVSMKQAKIQKATLDPLKISGRCGRLMCCLRYEEKSYDELRARLPKRKTRVQTPDGWGTVLDGQILTQLVLVQLDSTGENVAVAIEDLIPGGTPPPMPAAPTGQGPGGGPGGGAGASARGPRSGPGGPPPRVSGGSRPPARPVEPQAEEEEEVEHVDEPPLASASAGRPTPPAAGDQDLDDLGEWDIGESERPPSRDDRRRGPDGGGGRPPGQGPGDGRGDRRGKRRRRGGGGGNGGGGGGGGPGGGGGDRPREQGAGGGGRR